LFNRLYRVNGVLVIEARVCEQPAQGRYLAAKQSGVELATSRVASQRHHQYTKHHQATQLLHEFYLFSEAELTADSGAD